VRAYYRHVADQDLAPAGPQRIAAIVRQQALLAAQRPQGRAIVDVRPGGDAVLGPASDVIDIVTDDMPFLVDSITMELTRHGLSARVLVHPQLRIRRDITGAMHQVAGLVNGAEPARDELAESWTHIEIPRLGEGEDKILADDLQRVLGDVRVAAEDASRMKARALYLAEMLLDESAGPAGRARDDGAVESEPEIGALLRWLADGRFTFVATGSTSWRRARTGHWSGRWPGPGWASCATTARTPARSRSCRRSRERTRSTRTG